MTEDEAKALKAKRQARLKNAILPQGSGYAPRHITPPAKSNLPDWNYWRHIPKVEPWEACALALNIDPNSLSLATDGMGASGSGIVTYRGFPNNEAADRFSKLLHLLNANQFERQHFTENFAMGVRLTEFVAWCAPVVRDLTGRDIPSELTALAKAAPQAAPLEEAAPAVKVKGTKPAPVTQVNKLRRDILDPAIDKAIKNAGNMEPADVYLKLKELAKDEEPPFSGLFEGDALCYTNTNDEPARLTKEALGKRLERRANKAATN